MSALSGITIGTLLDWARTRMNDFETPAAEAETILSGLLRCSRTDLYLRRNEPLPDPGAQRFQSLVERRRTGEPAAYLLGNQPFGSLTLEVGPSVLIPRPETEWVADRAHFYLRASGRTEPVVLDVGTGSGCLSLGLAAAMTKSRIMAVDVSEDALAVARKNAARLGLADRVQFIESDLYSAVPAGLRGVFDMIVSNPPYVATPDLDRLSPDVLFEPRLALDGGPDGLRIIQKLIDEAPPFLRMGGFLMLEIGHQQGRAVADSLVRRGFSAIEIERDWNGLDRLAKGEWRGSI